MSPTTTESRGSRIELEGVRFAYAAASGPSTFSLALPSLTIEPGQQVALVGPSGSGKTTLLSLVAGILCPLQGTIRVAGSALVQDGRPVSEARRRRLRLHEMGLVFQELELVAHLTARENALLQSDFAAGAGLSGRELAERLETLAQATGLAGRMGAKPDALSQGERQRVALCRALLMRPPLLLIDEPTANLDQATSEQVFSLLSQEARASEATLLCVTHDPSGLGHFDRVLDMTELQASPPTSAEART